VSSSLKDSSTSRAMLYLQVTVMCLYLMLSYLQGPDGDLPGPV
jgi:hypothetical protein